MAIKNIIVSILYSIIGLVTIGVIGLILLVILDFIMHTDFVRELLTLDLSDSLGK